MLKITKKQPETRATTRDFLAPFFQDGFFATWCDPSSEPQCAKSWDRDFAEDDHPTSDIRKIVVKYSSV
jgi:hypothetical protein